MQNVNSLSRAAFCWSFQAVSGAKSRIICAALETLLLLATQGRERRGDREEREGEREFAQYERGREGERERETIFMRELRKPGANVPGRIQRRRFCSFSLPRSAGAAPGIRALIQT